MVRIGALFLGLALLPALGSSARAQEDPCERRTLPVSVVDKNGNPVDGLTAADFRGRFRGKPVQILSVEPDQRHRRFVILVDASRSMFDPTTWSMAGDIAADAYRHSRGKNSMALLVYSAAILKRVGLGGHAEDLAKLFADLDLEKQTRPHESRKTALWDALQAAIDELRPAKLGDVIYVITDGEDNVSKTRPSAVRRELLELRFRLFAFVIAEGGYNPLGFGEEGKRELMISIKESGGDFVPITYSRRYSLDHFWSSKKGRAATLATVGQLYKQMERFYRVQIKPERTVDRARGWKLEVVSDNGKPRHDVDVHYPQRLLPCRDTTP